MFCVLLSVFFKVIGFMFFCRLSRKLKPHIYAPEILKGKTAQSRPSVFPERVW
jgi:hypothetical protein